MNIPKLKKEKTVKTYHGYELIDDYAWIDQDNILEVLQDPKKLLPDVRKYLEENNKLTEDYFQHQHYLMVSKNFLYYFLQHNNKAYLDAKEFL